MRRYRHPLVLWIVIAFHVSTLAASFAAESPIDCHGSGISQGLDLIDLSRPEILLKTGLFDCLRNLTNSPLNLKSVVQPTSGSSLKNHPKNTACSSHDGEEDFHFFPSRFIHYRSLRLWIGSFRSSHLLEVIAETQA